MTDALEDQEDTVSFGNGTLTNLRFAGDIDGLAEEEEELVELVECLNKASTCYGMEISAKKTQLITSSTSGINKETKVNGQKLETVRNFKCLDSLVSDEDSKPAILSRIVQTTSALTRLRPVWNDGSIYFSQFQHTTYAFPRHSRLSVCLWIMDPHSRAAKKNTSHGNEVLPQDYASHTKTMLPTRKSVPRSSRQ